MSKFNISLIGTGSLGTALSFLVLSNRHHLSVFEPNQTNLQNFLHHPQIKKFKNITVCPNIENVLDKKFDYIIPCIPSKYIDSFYQSFFSVSNHHSHIISISKGLYPNTTKTISQQIKNKHPLSKFSVISGPTFANEILNTYPTKCTIATKTKTSYQNIQSIFSNHFFSTEYSHDLLAVEFGGILKNCYAVTLGIVDHFYEMNTKSLTIIQILSETQKLYQKLNLDPQNIYSLHFLGDLIATGLNLDSRNTTFGHDLKYKKNTTIEGADNISPILQLATNSKITLPILTQTQKIIRNPSSTNINRLAKILIS